MNSKFFGLMCLIVFVSCKIPVSDYKEPSDLYIKLRFACSRGDLKEVKKLLDMGINPNGNNKNQWLTLRVTQEGYWDIFEELLNHGAKIEYNSEHGNAHLMHACWKGREKFVKFFLDQGVDVNARDEEQATPLMYASSFGHKGIISLLLNNGARINEKDNEGLTPLHYASLMKRKNAIEMLLKHNANLTLRDNNGRTPFNMAIIGGGANCLKLLYFNELDVNKKDGFGITPIEYAIQNKDEQSLDFLIQNGGVLPGINQTTLKKLTIEELYTITFEKKNN